MRAAALVLILLLSPFLGLEGQGVPDVTGSWRGALTVPGGSLTLVVHLERSASGALSATLDSPDQGARGIPVESAVFEDGRLVLDVRAIGARYEGRLSADGRIEGTLTQGGAALPLTFERGAPPEPSRPQEPVAPFPYRAEEVRFRNDAAEITLAGTLTIPEGPGPFPAVALVSGSGPQNRDSELFGHRPFLVLADHLTRRGIAVLRADDRGVGASEGVFRDATSRDFADDAAAAVAYLRGRPEIGAGAVGLVGMSEGGIVAPMVAADGAGVAFIVLLAGPGVTGEEILYAQSTLIGRAMGASEEQTELNRVLQSELFAVLKEEEDEAVRARRMEEVFRRQFAAVPLEERAATGLTEAEQDAWIRQQISMMGGPWYRFFLMHDPAPVLRRVRVPVLALFGALDLQVPADLNAPAVEAALREGGNADFTVETLPRLNHLFQTAALGVPAEYPTLEETMSPLAMERVASWILERARP